MVPEVARHEADEPDLLVLAARKPHIKKSAALKGETMAARRDPLRRAVVSHLIWSSLATSARSFSSFSSTDMVTAAIAGSERLRKERTGDVNERSGGVREP
jgi:hypothetical protein